MKHNDYPRSFDDLHLKVEEKFNKTSQTEVTHLKDIVASINILKLGQTLDYHRIQQLISWLNSD